VQDDIAQCIAAAIEPELARRERELAVRKPPENLDAWECFQRGAWHFYRFTPEDTAEAERWFARAVQLDPAMAAAHAGLADVCIQEAFYGDPANRQVMMDAAVSSARRAVELDDRDSHCRFTLGRAHALRRETKEALAQLETAVQLNPSFAHGYFGIAWAQVNGGMERQSVKNFEIAERLSPHDPQLWIVYHMRAVAHYRLNELDLAEEYGRRAIRESNVTYWPYATLCSVLGALDKREEAKAVARTLLDMKPDYSLLHAREDFFFTAPGAFVDRYVAGLEKAGIPAGGK
jgi:tetratricopeptide (TPR) repeat protein